jgi:hypothetical protein
LSSVNLYDLHVLSNSTVIIVGNLGFIGICNYDLLVKNTISCQQLSFLSVGTTTLLFSITFLNDNYGFFI